MQGLRSCLNKTRGGKRKTRAVSFGRDVTHPVSLICDRDLFFSEPDYVSAEKEADAPEQKRARRALRDIPQSVVTGSWLPPLTRHGEAVKSALDPAGALTVRPLHNIPVVARGPTPLQKAFNGNKLPVALSPRESSASRAPLSPRYTLDTARTSHTLAKDARLAADIKGLTVPELKSKIREVAARRRERERRARLLTNRGPTGITAVGTSAF